jgi:hypothetical protein
VSVFPSGPVNQPTTEVAALRRRLEEMESRLSVLESNRAPVPASTNLHELANAEPMSQATDGHAVVFDQTSGLYTPRVNDPSLLFTMSGVLVAKTSDPMHARYPSSIVGVSADLSVFSSSVTFEVLVNGSPIVSVSMSSTSTGFLSITPRSLTPYTDLVTVETVTVDGVSAGLVVHVEIQ